MTDADEIRPDMDPDLRRRVHIAVDDLLYLCKDLLYRYTDEDDMYVSPGDLEQFGTVTGLIEVARTQVLAKLRAQLDVTDAEIRAVHDEIETVKRRNYPNYRPIQ